MVKVFFACLQGEFNTGEEVIGAIGAALGRLTNAPAELPHELPEPSPLSDAAAGLGIPCEVIASDLSQSNYSSYRDAKAKRGGKRPGKWVAKAAPGPGPRPDGEPPTVAGLIREAVAKGPKSMEAVTAFVRQRIPKVEDKQVAQGLYALRGAGKMRRMEGSAGLGGDGKWELVNS